jgi:hypothetical protein
MKGDGLPGDSGIPARFLTMEGIGTRTALGHPCREAEYSHSQLRPDRPSSLTHAEYGCSVLFKELVASEIPLPSPTNLSTWRGEGACTM